MSSGFGGEHQQQQQYQQDYWMPPNPNQADAGAYSQQSYAGFEFTDAGGQPHSDSAAYDFEMMQPSGDAGFGQDQLDFQTFAASTPSQQQSGNIYGANPYLNPLDGSYEKQSDAASPGEDFEDEPPLLEELGINPDFILQKQLKTFLDNSTEGAIYVSFGSNIKSSALPQHKQRILLEAFEELQPYKFLWKFEEPIANLPPNVEIMKWVPQQDVLRHSNVKLFVTQGGLQSLDEAMHTETPVLVIPFFGDQVGNAEKAQQAGIGKRLALATLTKDEFKATIVEIIKDTRYAGRMAEVHDLLTDQPMPALEKTVWWIEYVLRHKGARHMRSPMVDASAVEYYMIDVIGFLAGIAFAVLAALYVVLRLVIRLAVRMIYARIIVSKKLD